MFELSKQSQEFHKVPMDGYRLVLASFSKAWIPSLLGNILLLAPIAILLLNGLYTEASTWVVWIVCAALVLYPALMASVLLIVHEVAQGHEPNLKQALGRGIQCIVPNTIGAVLFIAFVGIGSVLLFLPGIFIFFSLSFWWFGVVIERESVLAAFRSSYKLVYGAWWRTAFVLSVSYAIPLALFNTIDKSIPEPDAYSEPTLVTMSIFGLYLIINLLVIVITPILFSALMVVQLNDLKCRTSTRLAATNNTALSRPPPSKPS